jgi:hypothetical protein
MLIKIGLSIVELPHAYRQTCRAVILGETQGLNPPKNSLEGIRFDEAELISVTWNKIQLWSSVNAVINLWFP